MGEPAPNAGYNGVGETAYGGNRPQRGILRGGGNLPQRGILRGYREEGRIEDEEGRG